MVLVVTILILLITQSKCEIDVFKDIKKNNPRIVTQKMPTIYRNLLLLKEDCGEVCDTSDRFVKKPGKYFDVITKEFECDFLLESSSMYQELVMDEQMIKTKKNDKEDYHPPRITQVPQEIAEMYTFDKRVPLKEFQFNKDAKWIENPEQPNWNIEDINRMMNAIQNGNLIGGYGIEVCNEMKYIMKEFMIENIEDKHVLVIGSILPWIEAILLHLGAKKVTTLEYGQVKNEHPKLNPITPEQLKKQVLDGNFPQFDAMVTFSSLEHSGLGRYGDSLNPWGDLITMAQAWCLLKPGARALVGIPGGTDAIHFNSNRSYGRIMLPHMFANWNQIYSTYRDFPESHSEIKVGDFCPGEEDNLMWCFQPMTVLEKPTTF